MFQLKSAIKLDNELNESMLNTQNEIFIIEVRRRLEFIIRNSPIYNILLDIAKNHHDSVSHNP
jgi:hypothetical protein